MTIVIILLQTGIAFLDRGKYGRWFFRAGCMYKWDPGKGENIPCVVIHHAIPIDNQVNATFRKDPYAKRDLSWEPFSNDSICCHTN